MDVPNRIDSSGASEGAGLVTLNLTWEGDAVAFAARDARGKRERPLADDPFWEIEVDPLLREKALTIRRRLRALGWTPCIPRGSGWRSRTEQALKVAAGYSKTFRSKHCRTDAAGGRAARAVDIVPAYWGWEPPKAYWYLLGWLAEEEGLRWGGYWGLNPGERARLQKVIHEREQEQIFYSVRLGWDPAHVELV